MRLKSKQPWLALAALVLLAALVGARPRPTPDPVVAGRPLSHWLEVLDNPLTAKRTEYLTASRVVFENTNHAVLQSLILDRIERSYSAPARMWSLVYGSLPPWLRSPLPEPHFGRIELGLIYRLDGITHEPSARQRAVIQRMLGYESLNNRGTSGALLVALSPSTQTAPEAIALMRQQLAVAPPERRLMVCVAIRDQRHFESWRAHREAVAGLLADLKLVATADPDPGARVEARKALDHLNSALGGLTLAGTGPEPKLGSALTPPALFNRPLSAVDRPLAWDAPGAAADLNLHLSSPAPAAGIGLLKP
ncbi:MAG TPA: hypothetical protein VMB21_21600 [Candidatus Limnocylindria bacterium]|nr:hypothetical protein [Candidatus Limnocylindria bacterium]